MRWTIALLLVGMAAPVVAQDDPLAPVLTDLPPPKPIVPVAVVPKDWRGVFAAIRAEDWADAQAGIDALPDGPLKPVAKAELYTAKNSPKADLGAITALLGEAPDLPQAVQLQRIAVARGAVDTPTIAYPARIVALPSAPRRHRSSPVQGEPAADALRAALEPLVKADLAVDAEALYVAAAPTLGYEARAEAAQRVAWIYYVTGLDADARRVAETGIAGATGEWGSQAHWIAGLAAWRSGDCDGAATHFRGVAYGRSEAELAAAGAYWAARSEMMCRRPQLVEPLMKAAAKSPESFYGLVARETLGMGKALPPTVRASAAIGALPNVRRAIELVAIGERGLAEEMLRHQCRIGSPSSHSALAAKARELDLPGAAFWIAHNGPMGAVAAPADRFPLPRWAPTAGWRVDPALAYAHVRQESDFRMAAVSPAGAVGLMQVRPGTAGDFARARGVALGNLADPVVNLEYGQSFIELMRGKAATRGQLPRVIAAYNAGPLPVDRWNSINDKGDPLLWIESLPYWETRYYVPAVLRNMWVYEGMAGTPQATLTAVAQHKWPSFPIARGSVASGTR
ncbi:MAG: lytic transglycosylase domain-containing protein [Sphingomicrobium sp.]